MSCRRRPMDDHNRWSKHLPDELIEMIVKRLTLVDSIRFAAVCPSWRSVSSQWFQRVTRLPWVLDSTEILDSETVNYRLYSPSEDTVYDLKFPREDNKTSRNEIRCSGSIDGWLIMSEWTWNKISYVEEAINYFLNPMTGDRIKLPLRTGFIPQSSAASSDPRCSDCIVALGEGSKLVFCRPRSHESWPWEGQQDCDRHIHCVKFHEDGKLYVLGEDGTGRYILVVLVLVLDPLNQSQGKGKCEKIIAYREKTIFAPGDPFETVLCWYPTFMWSSKGEFLLVWRIYRSGFPFQLFKIDDKSGYNPIWVNWETNDIAEDEVVFLSGLHSTSMSKSKSLMTTIDEAFLGLHCGKIFTYDPDRLVTYGLNVFDLWFTPNITK